MPNQQMPVGPRGFSGGGGKGAQIKRVLDGHISPMLTVDDSHEGVYNPANIWSTNDGAEDSE